MVTIVALVARHVGRLQGGGSPAGRVCVYFYAETRGGWGKCILRLLVEKQEHERERERDQGYQCTCRLYIST